MNLTFTGIDAYTVAKATNRLPEILNHADGSWRFATTMREARHIASGEPQMVRLSAEPRVIIEDLLREGVPPTESPVRPLSEWIDTHPTHEHIEAARKILAAMRAKA